TRKAAAEMRARVIRALRGEVRADEPCAPELGGLAEAARQHARSRGRSLEEDTQALRIQTIDSFTYWLASQLPIAARAGGALEVTETPDELYRRAARRASPRRSGGVSARCERIPRTSERGSASPRARSRAGTGGSG